MRSLVNTRWYALALIVIVDDEPLNLKMMRNALAKAGPFTSEDLLAKVREFMAVKVRPASGHQSES